MGETEGSKMDDVASVQSRGGVSVAKKGKKGFKKGAAKKAARSTDGIARFFNDYGESPHLQQIETSYLMYLEA